MTRHKTVYLVGVAIRAWSSILQISFPVFSALAWDTNTTASDITEKNKKRKVFAENSKPVCNSSRKVMNRGSFIPTSEATLVILEHLFYHDIYQNLRHQYYLPLVWVISLDMPDMMAGQLVYSSLKTHWLVSF